MGLVVTHFTHVGLSWDMGPTKTWNFFFECSGLKHGPARGGLISASWSSRMLLLNEGLPPLHVVKTKSNHHPPSQHPHGWYTNQTSHSQSWRVFYDCFNHTFAGVSMNWMNWSYPKNRNGVFLMENPLNKRVLWLTNLGYPHDPLETSSTMIWRPKSSILVDVTSVLSKG